MENKKVQVFGYILGELSFIILPFLVMTLIFANEKNLSKIFEQPEWALTAAVVFGQSIIRLTHFIVKLGKNGTDVYHYNVGALIALLILLGLVPSLIILALIYTSDTVQLWHIIIQMTLFVLSIVIFCFVCKLQVEQE
ncbi:hypothetical protein [Fluviicola chungangensis]|uniref:Uncharacterized protein n=1 Tax=Fluviicola chungangensis TaxID=2597671 RepID=A0A556N2G3_9FLAO|nr:hypothetical protein [Fluviicola chungangensis]TSJ46384.1 hypothetical protein FO442_04295 [Fluviicola chungangensis]